MPQVMGFTYTACIEAAVYITLLFFAIPIKLPKPSVIEEEFQNYITKFNKSYLDKDTYNHRLEAFRASLDSIDRLNANRTDVSAQFGLTKHSDLTPQEFMNIQTNNPTNKLHYTKTHTRTTSNVLTNFTFNVPKIVDWRDKNVVSKVKNQKNCGACWAFAGIGTIESMRAIKTGELVDLSVQEMIDCSTYNRGCQGGDICLLLSWLKDYNISIATEADYPLTLKSGKCRQNILKLVTYIDRFECSSYVGREDLLLKLIAEVGPVAVGVNGRIWQNYVGGVIQFHCDGDLSHAVQIVGYNLTAKVPYYIIKNSWGEDFGDNGYSYVAIGTNQCGIAHEVASLTVI